MSETSDLVVFGDTVEEKIQSLSQIVNAQNKKPLKQICKFEASSFVTKELELPEKHYPLLLIGKKGKIEDLIIFVKQTGVKDLPVFLVIEETYGTRTISLTSKSGFNSFEKEVKLEENNLVLAYYSIPSGVLTTPPVIGFSFTQKDVINVNPA